MNEYFNDYTKLIPLLFDEPPSEESSEDNMYDETSNDNLALFYGLVHARYIMTSSGLVKMAISYNFLFNDF